MTTSDYTNIGISFSLALLRVLGVKGDFFKTFAHFYLDGLFAVYLIGRYRLYLNLVIILCIVEILVQWLPHVELK